MTPQEISQTIISQLGGRKFQVMTGAKNFSFSKDVSLTFQIGSNAKKIKWVQINLEDDDTYTMTFLKQVKGEPVVASRHTDIYNDQLAKIFSAQTGMATSL
jgi:hypothetical protein